MHEKLLSRIADELLRLRSRLLPLLDRQDRASGLRTGPCAGQRLHRRFDRPAGGVGTRRPGGAAGAVPLGPAQHTGLGDVGADRAPRWPDAADALAGPAPGSAAARGAAVRPHGPPRPVQRETPRSSPRSGSPGSGRPIRRVSGTAWCRRRTTRPWRGSPSRSRSCSVTAGGRRPSSWPWPRRHGCRRRHRGPRSSTPRRRPGRVDGPCPPRHPDRGRQRLSRAHRAASARRQGRDVPRSDRGIRLDVHDGSEIAVVPGDRRRHHAVGAESSARLPRPYRVRIGRDLPAAFRGARSDGPLRRPANRCEASADPSSPRGHDRTREKPRRTVGELPLTHITAAPQCSGRAALRSRRSVVDRPRETTCDDASAVGGGHPRGAGPDGRSSAPRRTRRTRRTRRSSSAVVRGPATACAGRVHRGPDGARGGNLSGQVIVMAGAFSSLTCGEAPLDGLCCAQGHHLYRRLSHARHRTLP